MVGAGEEGLMHRSSVAVFVGETEGGDKVIFRLALYENIHYRPNPDPYVRLLPPEEKDRLFLQLNDEEIVELTNPQIEERVDSETGKIHVAVVSREWSGEAVGDLKDLAERIELEKRYRR